MLSREEYLSKIEIKEPAEAKKYLYLFRLILILLTISFFSASYFYQIENSIFWGAVFSLLTFVLISWFGYLYSRLQKKLNVPLYFSSVAEAKKKQYDRYDVWTNYWLASFLLRVIVGTANFNEGPFDPNRKTSSKLVNIVFNVAGWLLIALAVVTFIVLFDVVYYIYSDKFLILDLFFK